MSRRALHSEVPDGFTLCIGDIDSVLLSDFVFLSNIKLTITLIPVSESLALSVTSQISFTDLQWSYYCGYYRSPLFTGGNLSTNSLPLVESAESKMKSVNDK